MRGTNPAQNRRSHADISLPEGRNTALLVSVRTASEAASALAGGADVVDAKEPLRGPLGACERSTLQAISKRINGSVPLAACGGELCVLNPGQLAEWTAGLRLWTVKVGLANMSSTPDWRGRLEQLSCELPPGCGLVPVAYADWQMAAAPSPAEVCRYVIQAGWNWVLVDTFDKAGGNLLERWDLSGVRHWMQQARRAEVQVAVAGRLSGESLVRSLQLQPDLIGVRGAVCVGSRTAEIDSRLVADVKRQIQSEGDSVAATPNVAEKT